MPQTQWLIPGLFVCTRSYYVTMLLRLRKIRSNRRVVRGNEADRLMLIEAYDNMEKLALRELSSLVRAPAPAKDRGVK